jgi:parallel beta-helix repeat protein
VTLDCRGARIANHSRRSGILIASSVHQGLSDITVRNCHVEGFINGLRITRNGFRQLKPGEEYRRSFANILVEDSSFKNSLGVGAFIDGYVSGVTLRRLHIEGAGSAGIYLEAGSRGNIIENSRIVNNGYSENGPDGQMFKFAGLHFWFWGSGREGLAVDGSRNNRIVNNYFSGNSAGAIFLYRNCGEYQHKKPERWFDRRYGADNNFIAGNQIVSEDTGIWVAARMGKNTLPMQCSDPAYFPGFVLDRARGNTIRGNRFTNVTYGIRVEDDDTVIEDNELHGDNAARQGIIVGTRFRTLVLRRPVTNTTISGNRAYIAGNEHPYRWIHGERDTHFDRNMSFARTAVFCEGSRPPESMFVFARDFVLADPEHPPVDKKPDLPVPEPLTPCR